jgi:hypothetical protein
MEEWWEKEGVIIALLYYLMQINIKVCRKHVTVGISKENMVEFHRCMEL